MAKIFVVGMGPGGLEDMTPRAREAIEKAELVVGYSAYIELIRDKFSNKTFISSAMMKEVERCKLVLEKALEGKSVALISSGDSGIYGMAGLMLEIVNQAEANIQVEVISGITAVSAAAAVLGAPLMHDFAIISLSDLMTPWALIEKRLKLAAEGDFVIGLYNPKSQKRTEYIGIARDIIQKHRGENTPVGLVWNVGRENEDYAITTLKEMLTFPIDMFTVVIIGNTNTYVQNGKMITPRGYKVEL